MNAPSAITDLDRLSFMQALYQATQGEHGLILTQWETSFLYSFVSASRQSLWFTPRRRPAADNMRRKYGSELEIKMPFPLADTTGPKAAPAEVNCCQFTVRDEERRQRPCNEPATQQRRNGFRYCDEHATQVLRDLKRVGKKMDLFPYHPK